MPIDFVSVSTAAATWDNRAMHYVIQVCYMHSHPWFTDSLAMCCVWSSTIVSVFTGHQGSSPAIIVYRMFRPL